VSDRRSEARRLSGIRILVVEDDSDCLEALVTLLELNGAKAQGALCADAGRTVLARFRPHVLISDLSMPGEDGFTFLASVRALSPQDGGETPAVAFTAMSPTNAQQRAQSAGFQAFLRKPHDMLLVIPMVLQLLSTPS
jgi:CheY-like chemotaxis protein